MDKKVLEWLSKEGYPLEFKTANIFKNNKFCTQQGYYVNDFKTNLPREIDVIAEQTIHFGDTFLRVNYVVECKWSDNKPWVIFTDESSRISPTACIAQSIASEIFDTILWLIAGDKELHKLSLFHIPNRAGFNGCQAFNSHNDLVYSALQSVISACYSMKKKTDKHHEVFNDVLSYGILYIPIVVIKGRLFESFYNIDLEDIEIQEREKIRLHWRGADAWNLHSTVDVVTIEALPKYVEGIFGETNIVLKKAADVYMQIKECIEKKSLTPLTYIEKVSSGKLVLPPLLQHIKIQNNE